VEQFILDMLNHNEDVQGTLKVDLLRSLGMLTETQLTIVAYYLNSCINDGLITHDNIPVVIRVLIGNVILQHAITDIKIPGVSFFKCNILKKEPA